MTGPSTHGSPDHAELARLGLRADEVTDFSANVNPFGPAPEVVEAARNADLSGYPDRDCLALRRRIAEQNGVGPEAVICGNGSAELVDLLARTMLLSGDASLISGPTFSEYARASTVAGARVLFFDRRITPDGFRLDAERLAKRIAAEGPRLVWLCNPNNPTGDLAERKSIARVLEAARGVGGTLVVDEAYAGLVLDGAAPDLTDLLPGGGLVLLRSMTKTHALAGLRLGYALAAPETIRGMEAVRPPWMVGSPAQAAGLAALGESARTHLENSLVGLREQVRYLRSGFGQLGLPVLPSVTNYLLVRVGGRLESGGEVRRRLLKRGILVRNCASFGLPEYVRVAARPPDECRKLLAAFAALCGEDGPA